MKIVLILTIIFFCCISACTKNDQIYQGISKGIYEISSQAQEAKESEGIQVYDKKVPSFDQYKMQREEMLKEKD